MSDSVPTEHYLRRFWFKIEGNRLSPLGYGVTAWTEDDAVAILREQIFKGTTPPDYSVTVDVDISALDAGHVIPNMESPTFRGIWFPRGFSEPH